ncbi:DeoR family transcriptional regulator [Candidatus Nomurabacteria bacterium]|nr:DeoR family transcriptional regulator [Candidatus Nomurabacteria bacterium]
MNNQKDILQYQKDNTINTEVNSLNIKVFTEFAIKKTEKLVTALYMVTDCMEREDGMKIRLRTLGVDLLSSAHSFGISTPYDKQHSVDKSNSHIAEILSLIEIANTMGFVSEMNANILKKEFNILRTEIARFEEKNSVNKSTVKKVYSHTQAILDDQSFGVQLPVYKEAPMLPSQFWSDNISKGQNIKDNENSVFYKKHTKDTFSNPIKSAPINKEERSQKMLDLIKQKKDISIKDISVAFTDCSEKTIQRELNNLVSKGLLKKTGSKRWSRYSISC